MEKGKKKNVPQEEAKQPIQTLDYAKAQINSPAFSAIKGGVQ